MRDHPAAGDRERPFLIGAGAFLAAAAVVAVARGVTTLTGGWWLVAFFALVGGVAQWLLGAGSARISPRAGARLPTHARTRVKAALWNSGTLLVAAGDLAELRAGVLLGSAALLAALWLFARGLPEPVAGEGATRLSAGYAALLGFLALSVVVGAGLAGALPGQ